MSGLSVVGSVATLSYLNQPALSIGFDLKDFPNEKPKNIDSVVVDFDKFNIVPYYINSSKDLTIELEVKLEGQPPTYKSKTVEFSNGVNITKNKINSLTPIVVDGINTDADLLFGSIIVKVNHPDISRKYKKSFQISDSRTVVDTFEDNSLSEYKTLISNNVDIQSNQVFEGNYAVKLTSSGGSSNNTGIRSTSGLDNYPKIGDTIQFYWKTSNNSAGGRYLRFGDSPSSFYGISYQASIGKIAIRKDENNMDSKGYNFQTGKWYRNVIEWKKSGKIIWTAYDTKNGSEEFSFQSKDSDPYDGSNGDYIEMYTWSGSPEYDTYYDDIRLI
jgi:hypothetical protein